ncbi:MAG: hypothetical protein ACYCVY_13385, partial [Acidiferrobacteraceae bacterium]
MELPLSCAKMFALSDFHTVVFPVATSAFRAGSRWLVLYCEIVWRNTHCGVGKVEGPHPP